MKSELKKKIEQLSPVPQNQPAATSPPKQVARPVIPSISIKQAMAGNVAVSQTSEASEDTPKAELPSQEARFQTSDIKPISAESLETAWRSFADSIKSENMRLFSILTSNVPKLDGATKIVYPISNALQKEALQKVEATLMHHLQTALNTANVEIEIVVSENNESTKKAYTNEEKFAQMTLKNPALTSFKHHFMLDFV